MVEEDGTSERILDLVAAGEIRGRLSMLRASFDSPTKYTEGVNGHVERVLFIGFNSDPAFIQITCFARALRSRVKTEQNSN